MENTLNLRKIPKIKKFHPRKNCEVEIVKDKEKVEKSKEEKSKEDKEEQQTIHIFLFKNNNKCFLFLPNSEFTIKKIFPNNLEIEENVLIPPNFAIKVKAYKNISECLNGPLKQYNVKIIKKFENSNFIWKLYNPKKMKNLVQHLHKYQKYNHFPTTFYLGRKDSMWKNHLIFKNQFPSEYNFVPMTFILPYDAKDFQVYYKSDKKALWILKPVASSRGRGVRLLQDISEFSQLFKNSMNKQSQILISRYIDNPHVINNKKYDLRIYVLITSYSPLKIYIYHEGLVRFATEDYDKKNKKDIYIHLTNYSVNKHNEKYIAKCDNEENASKWSLQAYRNYFIKNNLDKEYHFMWEKLKDIVIKTILTVTESTIKETRPLLAHRNCIFELYGFDILIDSTFTPWLIEVNVNPSTQCDSQLDLKIKTDLMCDIITTVGVVLFNHKAQEELYLHAESKGTCKAISFPLPHIGLNSISGQMLSKIKIKISKEFDRKNLRRKSEEYEIPYYNEMINDFICEDLRSRTGGFELIFPLQSNIEKYSQFLEIPFDDNIVLWQWILTSSE